MFIGLMFHLIFTEITYWALFPLNHVIDIMEKSTIYISNKGGHCKGLVLCTIKYFTNTFFTHKEKPHISYITFLNKTRLTFRNLCVLFCCSYTIITQVIVENP